MSSEIIFVVTEGCFFFLKTKKTGTVLFFVDQRKAANRDFWHLPH